VDHRTPAVVLTAVFGATLLATGTAPAQADKASRQAALDTLTPAEGAAGWRPPARWVCTAVEAA